MKTLEEAGNSSPLRLYLSGATPPLFHFANRTSAAPLRLTRCSRVAAAADAPKGEADGSDPAKFDARSSGSSSAASASPKTPADARRTPAFRPRGLSTPGTPASPLVATTSASAPCECPQPPQPLPPSPPLKHGDRLRALGAQSRARCRRRHRRARRRQSWCTRSWSSATPRAARPPSSTASSTTSSPRRAPPACPLPRLPAAARGRGRTAHIDRQPEYSGRLRRYKSTVGADFSRKIVQWDERTTVRLQLWDIAGQDRFGPPPSRAPGPGF